MDADMDAGMGMEVCGNRCVWCGGGSGLKMYCCVTCRVAYHRARKMDVGTLERKVEGLNRLLHGYGGLLVRKLGDAGTRAGILVDTDVGTDIDTDRDV